MDSLEPKKLALIRIWQILHKYSDYDHPLTQEDISRHLERDYGIVIERKSISRNISMLKEIGVDIESRRAGSYMASRDFEDSELRLLIDGVLSSQHIAPNYSKNLIEKLCALSNKFFRSHVKNIHTVSDWNKTGNKELFYNIELVDNAIEEGVQISYNYNKYSTDKEFHKSSRQQVSPYQLILHNQRYYLIAHSTYWDHMVFHRMDRISNMELVEEKAKPVREVKGFEHGLDLKKIATTRPYLYTDEPQRIKFVAGEYIIDHVIDWFGKDIKIEKTDDEKMVMVTLTASPTAMEHWALQYLEHVEVKEPATLRARIRENLAKGLEKY